MNHHKGTRKFGRLRKVRVGLMKSLAVALVLEGKIKTTDAKAREQRLKNLLLKVDLVQLLLEETWFQKSEQLVQLKYQKILLLSTKEELVDTQESLNFLQDYQMEVCKQL